MKNSCLLCVLLLIGFFTKSQTVTEKRYIDIANISDSFFINNCQVFVDSTNKLPANQLSQKMWTSLAEFKIKAFIPKAWVTQKVYLQLNLTNTDSVDRTIYFYPGFCFQGFKTYRQLPDNSLETLHDLSRDEGFQPIALPAKQKQTFIIKLDFAKTGITYLLPQIIEEGYLKKYQKILYHRNESSAIVGYLLSGILLMMFFFSMANYILSGKKEFLLNGCYTGCMFLLFFLSTYFDKKSGFTASFFLSYLAFALLIFGTLFYIGFTRKFLDTHINFPLLDKLFFYEQLGLLIILLAFSYLHFFSNNFKLQSWLENTAKITALLIGIVYIVTALLQKNKLLNYLAAGNTILIFFAILSFYFLLHPSTTKGAFVKPVFYYEFGIVSELLFFLMGLTYKNRIELIEKIQEQEAMKLAAEKQLYETKIAVLNAQQQERNRISADMHDDLGAGITSIRLYSELAKHKIDKSALPEIDKISASANELLNNMNAIIWTMSSSNNTLADMVAYIRSYSQEYFENTGVTCKIEIPDHVPDIKVSSQIRRNVYLVVKEALNNILKHAKATTVSIVLKHESAGLTLYIQDNGTGINFEKIRRFGNGLVNMKRRMDEMNIDFLIKNNEGTLIKLHYKLPIQ